MLESILQRMKEEKERGDIAAYNLLVKQYNKALESESVNITDSDFVIPSSQSESSIPAIPLYQQHSGISNTILGLVKNHRKGKYSEQDKQYFISLFSKCIKELEEIDCSISQKEALRRKLVYSPKESVIIDPNAI